MFVSAFSLRSPTRATRGSRSDAQEFQAVTCSEWYGIVEGVRLLISESKGRVLDGPTKQIGRGCASLNDMARALIDSYGVMCRSGHTCAQPVPDSCTSGEVLRASASIYNTASEIETLFGGLDELVKWFAPSWPRSEIALANECHPRMIFASSSRRRVTHTETMCSEVGQCRVNCHGAPSPSAGSILRFALPSAESVKAKRSTGSARLKPRALM